MSPTPLLHPGPFADPLPEGNAIEGVGATASVAPTLARLTELVALAFQVARVRLVVWEAGGARCLAQVGEPLSVAAAPVASASDASGATTPRAAAFDDRVQALLQERGYCVVPDVSALAADPVWKALPGVRFLAAVALTGEGGQAWGALCLADASTRSLSDDQARMLATFASVAVDQLTWHAHAQHLVQRHAALEQHHGWMMESASQDPLTQVSNRRALMVFLDKTLALARRELSPVSVLVLNIRGFRQVNQRLGDTAGDRVLCEVASRLSACMRGSELVGRMSGDEFMAVLYPCTREQALLATERYVKAASAQPVALAAADGMTVQLRLGAGSSTAGPREWPTSDELYRLAASDLDAAPRPQD